MHAFPLLAFVRGEAFTPEHWDTLFRTLEFQRTKGAEDRVTVESLTLGHFLDKADVLKQNEAALKNLFEEVGFSGNGSVRAASASAWLRSSSSCCTVRSMSCSDAS